MFFDILFEIVQMLVSPAYRETVREVAKIAERPRATVAPTHQLLQQHQQTLQAPVAAGLGVGVSSSLVRHTTSGVTAASDGDDSDPAAAAGGGGTGGLGSASASGSGSNSVSATEVSFELSPKILVERLTYVVTLFTFSVYSLYCNAFLHRAREDNDYYYSHDLPLPADVQADVAWYAMILLKLFHCVIILLVFSLLSVVHRVSDTSDDDIIMV